MYFYNQFLFFSCCFYNNFNDDLLSFASLLLTHSSVRSLALFTDLPYSSYL